MKTKQMRLMDGHSWDGRPKGAIVEVLLPESYGAMDALREGQGNTAWTLTGNGTPDAFEAVVLTLDRQDYWYYHESWLEEV